MTADEVTKWKQIYKTPGTFPWVSICVDVEGYFCDEAYLTALYGVSAETATAWRTEAASKVTKAKETFMEKRKVINRVLWPDGGSPHSDSLWADGGGQSPANVLGKSLFSALKPIIKANGHDDKKLDHLMVPQGFELAPDLRSVLAEALGDRYKKKH